jgi:PTS system nitrogen regulatory IIA component
MQIGDILERGAIAARASATGKRQVLAAVAEIAARQFGLQASYVLDCLLEREDQGSTGVGHGVAAPHARLEGIDRIRGVFLRLETPVAFESIDDQPVDLIFALFAPEKVGAEHLRALARVSRLLRQESLRDQLRKALTPDAIHVLLVQDLWTSAA